MNRRFDKREELISTLLKIWNDISQEEIIAIIEHVECVYEEVIERKGEYIKSLKRKKIE